MGAAGLALGAAFAWLYRVDLAAPKRTPSAAQLDAIESALAARRVCATCGPVENTVRTSDQLCGDCYAATQTIQTSDRFQHQ